MRNPTIALLLPLVVAAAAVKAGSPPAHLTVFSESGVPHSGVLVEFANGKQEWLGFMPKTPRKIVDDGRIDETNREKEIASFIRFALDDETVRRAREAAVGDFKDRGYKLGVCDCVSFSVRFAKEAGLKVPSAPNLSPGNLVENLHRLNKDAHTGKFIHVKRVTSDTKFPWTTPDSDR